MQKYTADADKVIAAGFVLPEDRGALLAYEDPSNIKG
jgi:hypothetical protein